MINVTMIKALILKIWIIFFIASLWCMFMFVKTLQQLIKIVFFPFFHEPIRLGHTNFLFQIAMQIYFFHI